MQKYLHTTWRLWKLLKPFHKYFYWQVFLTALIQLTGIASVILASHVINNVVGKSFLFAAYLTVSYFILNFFKTQFDYYKSTLSNKHITFSIQQFLEEYSFKNIFRLNISQYTEDHSAIKLQVINRGENAVQSIISTIMLSLLPTATQIIFSLFAIAWYSPIIAFLTLGSLSIAIIWTNYFTNYQRPFIKKNIDNWDTQRKVRTEAFQHLNLIKTSGVEKIYLSDYLSNRAKILDHSIYTFQLRISHGMKRWNFFSFTNTLSRLLLIYKAYLGQITIGNIYAVWTWINDTNNNIFNVMIAMRDLPINYVELEKYLNIIDKEPEFNEHGEKKFEFGDIEFKDVSFKYPKGENYLLEDFNLTIEKGKKTAFVGFSGSGKSTIIKLLLRMYDWNDGDITVAGKSLRDIDAQTWRQKIGYVEQHVDLFDISIGENILFGLKNKKLSEEKLDEIVHKARIDQFFHRLGSTGLDTIIGERGVKLSGGERQRIGIARALAKDPEILIFDEATASLDTENEKYIQEAIDESSKGRTTIIIAHRLSTVQNSDKIIVMDKGKVVAVNTHDYLKESSPEYQRLIHAQTA